MIALILVGLGLALVLWCSWEDRTGYEPGPQVTPYTGPLYTRHGREIEPAKIRSVA